jgi:hypothetical protein
MMSPALVGETGGPRSAAPGPGRALATLIALSGGLVVFLSWPAALWFLAPYTPGILMFRVFAAAWGFFGITQLLYLMPLHAWAAKKGHGSFCEGIRIGAKVVLVVNGALIAFFLLWPFPLLN